MSDDIVKRLRAETDGATVNPDGIEAADIIERLEAELATERERADARRKTVSMLCRENAEMEADRDKAEAERDALRALLRGVTAVLEPVSFNMYDHDIREAARVMVSHINAAMNKGGGNE